MACWKEGGAVSIMTKREKRITYIWLVVMLLAAIIFLVPFVFVVMNSVKPLSEIMKQPLSLPEVYQFENYVKVFEYIDIPRVVCNTAIVCVLSLAGIILLCSMTAFWCECFPTKFSNLYKKILMVSMLVPFASLMIPLVKVMSILHLNNTLFGVALTFCGIGQAFAFFIIDGAAQSIPMTLYEAAVIDGASPIQMYFKIALPLMKPSLISVFVMDLFWIWNDAQVSLILLNNQNLRTIQLAINTLFGAYASKWDVALPALVLTILPMLVVYLFVQKQIIEGVSAGAVKG